MTARHESEVPAGSYCGQNVATGPQDNLEEVGAYWDVRVGRGGKLTATLIGTQPPLVVTADDEKSLRKQINILILRAML
jgi:hypothetical protein